MVSVTHYGHGVYCYECNETYEDTDDCDHHLGEKAGIRSRHNEDEYFAQPDDMGHHSPCHFIDVDGRQMCAECDKVEISAEEVPVDE